MHFGVKVGSIFRLSGQPITSIHNFKLSRCHLPFDKRGFSSLTIREPRYRGRGLWLARMLGRNFSVGDLHRSETHDIQPALKGIELVLCIYIQLIAIYNGSGSIIILLWFQGRRGLAKLLISFRSAPGPLRAFKNKIIIGMRIRAVNMKLKGL